MGGQFGQNGQKLHENYKIGILGCQNRGGGGWDMGRETSQFWGVVEGSPPSPPP